MRDSYLQPTLPSATAFKAFVASIACVLLLLLLFFILDRCCAEPGKRRA